MFNISPKIDMSVKTTVNAVDDMSSTTTLCHQTEQSFCSFMWGRQSERKRKLY